MFRLDLITRQAGPVSSPTYLARLYGDADRRVTTITACCQALTVTTLGWGEAAHFFIIVRHINAMIRSGWAFEFSVDGGTMLIGQDSCQVTISHQDFLQLIAHHLDPTVRYDPFGWQEAYVWTTSTLISMKQLLDAMNQRIIPDTQLEMIGWRDTLNHLVYADLLSIGETDIALITNPATRRLLIGSSLVELWGAWSGPFANNPGV
jgi:hypothetical protein